jgi:hypothetical protein
MAGPERVSIALGLPEPKGTPYLWHAKGVSNIIETGEGEDGSMDFKDRRIWYAVAAVIIVLVVIGYSTPREQT